MAGKFATITKNAKTSVTILIILFFLFPFINFSFIFLFTGGINNTAKIPKQIACGVASPIYINVYKINIVDIHHKIIFFIFSCLIFGLSGCEQKIDTWSGKDVAYVDMEADSTLVSFIYINTDVDTVQVRVQVMGNIPEDQPRYVDVKVKAENATVGTDYEAIENRYTIEGGNIFCTIPVVLKRPADQTIKAVEIELMENEYFHLYYLEDVLTSGSDIKYTKTKHRIVFHNIMKEPPATWNEYYFGNFTVKKFETICEVMEISRDQFFSYSYMSFGKIRFIASYMKDYLERFPIPDEDGKNMKMGDSLYV